MRRLILLSSVFLVPLVAKSQCAQFHDGFESGSYSPTWVNNGGNYTYTVPNTGSAVGTDHLRVESHANNLYQFAMETTFGSGQPTSMSWWMRTETTDRYNGFVVIGDSMAVFGNEVVKCCFDNNSNLVFTLNSSAALYPIAANTWYFVETRNVSWTARTMDVYVNNVLVLPGWPFRSTMVSYVAQIALYSTTTSSIVEYDDFTIGSGQLGTMMSSGNVSCFSGSDGWATTTASGGNGIYSYTWAPSGGTAATASGLTAGTYTCTIIDGLGCTGTATVMITQPTPITATVTQTNIACYGGNNGGATALFSGGMPPYTYSWTPTGGTSSTANGLTAGIYTCTVTDATGCTNTAVVNITQPSQPLMTAAANNGNVCPNDTAVLSGTATGGTMNYTYNWMPGNMPGSVASSNPVNTTTYTLLVTDANGCTSTSTTTVTVYAAPVVSLGTDITACGSATLDAQNAGSTYLWSEGSTTQAITLSMTGPYDVVVTNGNGCTGRDTINVTINANPVVVGSAAMNFVCTGEPAVQLFGSPAGATWTGNGVSGSTFEPDTAGVGIHALVYSFTDSLGCSGVDTVSITVDLCLGTGPVADARVNVYPNPTNGVFEILFNTDATDVLIEITDIEGRVVYSSTESSIAQGAHKQVDLSAQAGGIYILRVNANDASTLTRIVIQH